MLTSRVRPLCASFVLLAGASAGAVVLARPADAQIAGVLAKPRPVRPARDSAGSADTTVRVGRTAAKVPAQERQRLDIQAWVDSAAGALAQSPPTPIPAPGTTSIFNAPAVPDSLRPPAAPAPTRPRRLTRRTRRTTAGVPRSATTRDLLAVATGPARGAARRLGE